MKRIIYLGFNNFYNYKRGVENVIEFQSSILNEWCYYIHWGEELKIYRYKKMVCVSLPINSVWRFVLLFFVIRRIIVKNKKDVFIHSHNALMSVFLCRNTDLFTIHDGLYYQQKSLGVTWWKQWLFYVMEKVLYKRCSYLHFISNFTKSKSLCSSSCVKYVNIYNTSSFELQALNFNPDISKLHMDYPFLVNKKYCLIVRSLEERARIDLVIDVALKRQDLFFVIAGKGPLLTVMQERIDTLQLQNVKLLGFVTDKSLFQLYTFSSLVMVPAEYGEGFGLPIIEAYIFNKPVVASRCCAIPEVIIDDRYLFENNVASVLESIHYCEHCERRDFFKYYQVRFSQKVILEQYKRLYKECI